MIKEGKRVLSGQEREILDMIRSQHHEGMGRDDKIMQRGYSKSYGKRRKKKGLQTKFVDLHFTGKFHKSLDLVPTKEGMDVQSTEPYGYYVKANFPTSAGLTKENAEKVATLVANILAPKIKNYLIK